MFPVHDSTSSTAPPINSPFNLSSFKALKPRHKSEEQALRNETDNFTLPLFLSAAVPLFSMPSYCNAHPNAPVRVNIH